MKDNVQNNLKLKRLNLNYVPKNDLPMCEIEIGDDFKTLFDFGECHLFAAALNKLFGYRMRVIYNENRKGGKGVVHAYATVNYYGREFLLDASGQTDSEVIKEYIKDEINEEKLEPVFTSECYDNYEEFLNVFINEFKFEEDEKLTLYKTIDDVECYLRKNMRTYVPQYQMTVDLAEKYEWQYISEEIVNENECRFVFKNDECESLFIRLCRNHGYDIELQFEEEIMYQAFPDDIKELELELDRMITGDYNFNKN